MTVSIEIKGLDISQANRMISGYIEVFSRSYPDIKPEQVVVTYEETGKEIPVDWERVKNKYLIVLGRTSE